MAKKGDIIGYVLDEDWLPEEAREPESYTEEERARIIQKALREGKLKEDDIPDEAKYLMYLVV